MSRAKIVKVSGPLVVATGLADAMSNDVVRVTSTSAAPADRRDFDDEGDSASIQVRGDLRPGTGAEVVTTGAPGEVELGPGMIEHL